MKIAICKLTAALIFCVAQDLPSATAAPSSSGDDPAMTSLDIGQKILDAGGTGSLILRGNCGPNGDIEVSFHGNFAAKTFTTDLLNELSGANPKLAIHRDPSGFWRILDGTVPADLLKIKIARLAIHSYSGNDAVSQIFQTLEVKSFLRAHSIKIAPSFGGLAPVHPESLRRNALQLRETSIGTALDQIVRKYHGVWLYEECRNDNGQALISVDVLQ